MTTDEIVALFTDNQVPGLDGLDPPVRHRVKAALRVGLHAAEHLNFLMDQDDSPDAHSAMTAFQRGVLYTIDVLITNG